MLRKNLLDFWQCHLVSESFISLIISRLTDFIHESEQWSGAVFSPKTQKSVCTLSLVVPSSGSLRAFLIGFQSNIWNKVCVASGWTCLHVLFYYMKYVEKKIKTKDLKRQIIKSRGLVLTFTANSSSIFYLHVFANLTGQDKVSPPG